MTERMWNSIDVVLGVVVTVLVSIATGLGLAVVLFKLKVKEVLDAVVIARSLVQEVAGLHRDLEELCRLSEKREEARQRDHDKLVSLEARFESARGTISGERKP